MELGQELVRLLRLIPTLGKPIAAAVNGDALASGASLVAACDYAAAADTARIGTMEVSVGVWPMIAQVPLIHRIGARAAMENIGSGEPFSAERSLEVGLVQKVVRPGEEIAAAHEWLSNASRAPRVSAAGRRSVYELASLPYPRRSTRPSSCSPHSSPDAEATRAQSLRKVRTWISSPDSKPPSPRLDRSSPARTSARTPTPRRVPNGTCARSSITCLEHRRSSRRGGRWHADPALFERDLVGADALESFDKVAGEAIAAWHARGVGGVATLPFGEFPAKLRSGSCPPWKWSCMPGTSQPPRPNPSTGTRSCSPRRCDSSTGRSRPAKRAEQTSAPPSPSTTAPPHDRPARRVPWPQMRPPAAT